MGIPLQNAAIHKGAGIPLIGIADNEAFSMVSRATLPFDTRWKPAASAAPQSGILDGRDNGQGIILRQARKKCFITTSRHVLFDFFGINATAVAERNLDLPVIKGDILQKGYFGNRFDALKGIWEVLFQQGPGIAHLPQHLFRVKSAFHVPVNDIRDFVFRGILINDPWAAFLVDFHQGLQLTKPQAPGFSNLNIFVFTEFGHGTIKGFAGTCRNSAGRHPRIDGDKFRNIKGIPLFSAYFIHIRYLLNLHIIRPVLLGFPVMIQNLRQVL